jgi:hypothetical protein
MSDTEILDLIEHYKWAVLPQTGGGWVVEEGDDDEAHELVRIRGSLRDAVKAALGTVAARV